MGNMSEEMRKVMTKWGASEQQHQPEEAEAVKPRYRVEIYNTIRDNPGITSNRTLDLMIKRGFKQTYSSISSQITTLYQDFMLRREQIPNPAGIGRDVYTYFAVPEDTAGALRAEHKRKQEQAKLRAERARQAKADKAAARAAESQPHIQIPLPLEEKPTTVPPAPPLQSMTAIEILNGINFSQARDLYKELKEAFGG
jgi:hypothetical protein